MDRNGLDKRFRQVALDALKSFRHTEFTVRFLKRQNLPVSRNLTQMWADIQAWLIQGDDSRCLDLLEYVDDLKIWGRQRIFLFEINGEQEEFTAQLSDPSFVRGLVGDVYDKPLYRWQADEPFLAQVKHATDPYTGAPMLVFELIEMRTFDLLIDGISKSYEERSTNFFVVNLEDSFAELRLQQLPTGAHRNLKEERRLFEKEIRKHLGRTFDRFSPIPMEPIMGEMLRRPIYPITATEFKAGKDASLGIPTLKIVLTRLFTHLFRNPIPNYIAAYWKCKQDVLGESKLHFRLYGGNDSVAFGGIADPGRINDILKNMVDIGRKVDKDGPEPENGPIWKRGLVDKPYKNHEGQPKAQAYVLSAGVIAASMIWIVIEGVGKYLLEDWVERILGGVPLIAITILIELLWIWLYYGSNRIKRSFRILWSMKLSGIWRTAKKARQDSKGTYRESYKDQHEESDCTDLGEPEEDD
jgi:hypothetical protein